MCKSARTVVANTLRARGRHGHDLLGHLDIGARRCWIARRVIVQQTIVRATVLMSFDFRFPIARQGTRIGGGKRWLFVIIMLDHARIGKQV